MRGQEPAPWLLLCRDSDLLNTDGYADRPTSYDKVYVDLMQAYRNAARIVMSVADSMGRVASPHPDATALAWRIALELESALWIYRGADTDPKRLIEIMAREFRRLRRRFDVIHLHDKREAAECRMANMLVAEVLRCYKLPMTARWLIDAYSEITAKPQTTEPPGAKHARWYLRRNRNSAAHVRGMQRYLAARALSTSRPPHGARNSADGVGGAVGQPTRDTNYVAMPMNFERTKETTERQEGDWLPGSRLATDPGRSKRARWAASSPLRRCGASPPSCCGALKFTSGWPL
jgi:hypothetical protein